MTPQDVAAKRELMAGFFNDLDDKVGFLKELTSQGHRDEASMLCVLYLDGLASWLGREERDVGRRFCRALSMYGGEEVLGLVLPERLVGKKQWPERMACVPDDPEVRTEGTKQVDGELPWGSAPAGAEDAIRSACKDLDPSEVLSEDELCERVKPRLAPNHVEWLRREVWRGTVAHDVYKLIRCLLVHRLAAPGLLYSSFRYHGEPLPEIDFDVLYRALKKITAHTRGVLLETN